MIYVVGDIHNYFGKLNVFLDKKKPELILACGDFGYWPNTHTKEKTEDPLAEIVKKEYKKQCELSGIKYEKIQPMWEIKNKESKILFCDGNHEDHDSLDKLTNMEIRPNIFYKKRGSTYRLKDGRNILFMGGADSIDKNSRTPGLDWFPQENISYQDMNNLPDCKIDIVISHTCPTCILPIMNPYDPRKRPDGNNVALQIIMEKYRPSLWYFGHWHKYKEGFLNQFNMRWIALNHITSGEMWWQKLR